MLLTSAADSTVMHNKFANFADYNVPNLANIATPSNSASRNIEVNLGEVSSSTDILPSPPAKSEHDGGGFLVCGQQLPHESSISIKRDPEHNLYSSASVLHSPAFFSPQSLSQSTHFYQTPAGSCATNAHYPAPAQYNNSRGYNMYAAPTAHHFSGALSSLISQSDLHNSQGYSPLPSSQLHAHPRDSMSADLAAAGAVAAAAARARVVGGVEEEVMNQQRASRRQMHKICEQKRRDGLKTAMETLKMTIPGCSILSDQSQQNILLKGRILIIFPQFD